MQESGKRKSIIRNTGVGAGSVWDTRIKMDEFEGGIKVFDAGTDIRRDEEGMRVYHRRLRRNQSDATDTAERRKRRSWRPPLPVSGNSCIKNPGQLRKARSELSISLKICNEEEEDEDEVEDTKSFDDKEIDVAVNKPEVIEEKVEEEEIHPIPEIPISGDDIERKQNHVADLKKKESEIAVSDSVGVDEEEEEMFETSISRVENRMQSIVDLVMWRDVSKSAFVFGSGSFILLSSSYAKDLNFSLISAMCYLGLVYLALIFLCKSILRRGSMEFDERDKRYVIGEEEAIWVLRFLLPYINEVLLKIRVLFSGDPATTMKLALLLFFLARFGGNISTWTLAKFVFFGVFTIPKVFSSYSVHLAKYGKFWLERFGDGWESCSHKKAVAAAIFTIIWNLSSTITRVWGVFMLVVAVKLYQQCTLVEQWNGTEEDQESMMRMEQDSSIRSQNQQRNNGHRDVKLNKSQGL